MQVILAVFKIDEYLKYEKPGQFGDAKVDTFSWNLKPESDSNKLHPEFLEIVKNLQLNQKVGINWTHFYIHNENGAHPESSVSFFEKN